MPYYINVPNDQTKHDDRGVDPRAQVDDPQVLAGRGDYQYPVTLRGNRRDRTTEFMYEVGNALAIPPTLGQMLSDGCLWIAGAAFVRSSLSAAVYFFHMSYWYAVGAHVLCLVLLGLIAWSLLSQREPVLLAGLVWRCVLIGVSFIIV